MARALISRRRAVLGFLGAASLARADEPAAATEISLVISGGKVVSGPNLVKLKRDDRVVLTVVADAVDELHLHGYDLHMALRPGRTETLKFAAKRTGRFALELHRSGTEVGIFEIYPR